MPTLGSRICSIVATSVAAGWRGASVPREIVGIAGEDLRVQHDGLLGLVGVAAVIGLAAHGVDDVRAPAAEDGRTIEFGLGVALGLGRKRHLREVRAEGSIERFPRFAGGLDDARAAIERPHLVRAATLDEPANERASER